MTTTVSGEIMDPAKVFLQHRHNPLGGCVCQSQAFHTDPAEDDRLWSQHLFAELAAAGVALVELPTGDPDDDGQLWFSDGELRVDRSGGHAAEVYSCGRLTSSAALRAEAVEALAAAAASEQT